MKNKKLSPLAIRRGGNIKNKKYCHIIIFLITLLGFGIWDLGFSAFALPIISNVELTSVTDASMIITWSTTDEATTTEIEYGIGSLTDTASVSGTTKYHYLELTGLYPNTTYKYRVKSTGTSGTSSLSSSSFKTLERPSGEHLFSFAVINDLRYAPEKSNKKGGMGIPYQYCASIITSEVTDINEHEVAFTVINGNIADYVTDASERITYNAQINTDLKSRLEPLKGASDYADQTDLPSSAYKYLPIPGFHDKKATYQNPADDWLTYNMLPLTTNPGTNESRYTALYGYASASKDADSVFNYQFKYRYYNFIFLDAVKDNGSGAANLTFLNERLSADPNSKTFVFMNFPGYDPLDPDTKDYPVDLPTSEVGGGIFSIDNHVAFRTTLEAFTTAETAGGTEYPITAAVISGHLGDNYKRDKNNISYVRQGPAVAYPAGYSIYKVHTNGYIKTFYKTKGRDSNDKPYYEYARDQISTEAVGGTEIPAEVLTQFWLGSNSMRNFTYTYPFIPGVSPTVLSTTPTSGESGVTLNRPIIINFNKRMSEQTLDSWVSISPSAGTITARFLDANKKILSVSHSQDFTEGVDYTVTVSGSLAQDEGGTAMGGAYAFTFDTSGGTKDENPPVASIGPLADNMTTDPFPSFKGSVSDESGVMNVEYRIDNAGSWISAEAIDGTFDSTMEAFKIIISSPLASGIHQLWIRTTDGAGNTSTDGFLAYSFTVAAEKPTISLRIDNKEPITGDPISPTPKIEITITSVNSLESARLTLASLQPTLTFNKVDINYFATHEVTSALSDGAHGITVEAFDTLGKAATYEIYPLYVQSAADATIQGVPLNYPNPFDPGTQSTTIGYVLSKPSNITLNILDLAGNLMAKKTYSSAENGGKAGYNEVAWDGKSDSGNYVGNGIYIYLIIADGKVVQNGKGKITVFKR